jgi:histidine triad (HIT) family protein
MSKASGGACVFCAVLAGEKPARFVVDEPACAAFLDARPLFPGHVLVVPRVHRETLGDLEADAVGPLFLVVQRVARAVEQALLADGTFVALNNNVSQSVPHLHVHVVPRRLGDGLRGFFWPRTRYGSDAEADAIASAIRAALAAAAT